MKSHCPYCGHTTEADGEPNLTQAEIAHMNAAHPDVVEQRLINAGLKPGERKDIPTMEERG